MGSEANLVIKKNLPDTRIIMLIHYHDREYVSRFLKAGISRCLLKKAVETEFINAIRAMQRGAFYLFPSIASEVVAGYLDKDKNLLNRICMKNLIIKKNRF